MIGDPGIGFIGSHSVADYSLINGIRRDAKIQEVHSCLLAELSKRSGQRGFAGVNKSTWECPFPRGTTNKEDL
jgi:hypothetical protein